MSIFENIPPSLTSKENLTLLSQYREETNLIKKEQIRDEIVRGNLRLVPFSVKHLRSKNAIYEPEDLLAMGSVGLINAIDSFELEKGFQFSTFASRCIYNEVAKYMKIRQKHLVDYTSLDTLSALDNHDKSIANIVADDKIVPFSELVIEKETIQEAFHVLSEMGGRYKKVFEMYYFEELTLRQIGEKLGFSHQNAQLIIKKGLSKIRNTLNASEFLKQSTLREELPMSTNFKSAPANSGVGTLTSTHAPSIVSLKPEAPQQIDVSIPPSIKGIIRRNVRFQYASRADSIKPEEAINELEALIVMIKDLNVESLAFNAEISKQ